MKTDGTSKTSILLGVAALVLAVLCASLLRTNRQKTLAIAGLEKQLASVEAPAAAVIPPAAPGVADSRAKNLERQLAEARREAAELRQVLGEKDQEIAEISHQKTEVSQRSRRDSSGDRRRNWMAQLKEENPERYEEIQKRIQEMNLRRKEGLETQLDFIVSIDPERLNDEQLANHTKLLEKLQQLRELNDQMQNPGEDADPRALHQQMREAMGGVRELLDNERGIVLEQFAKDLGYTDKGATEFAEYIQEAYDKTSFRNVIGWGRGSRSRPSGDSDRTGNPR